MMVKTACWTRDSLLTAFYALGVWTLNTRPSACYNTSSSLSTAVRCKTTRSCEHDWPQVTLFQSDTPDMLRCWFWFVKPVEVSRRRNVLRRSSLLPTVMTTVEQNSNKPQTEEPPVSWSVRQTVSQTDRQTDRQSDSQTVGQKNSRTVQQTIGQSESQSVRLSVRQTVGQSVSQLVGQKDSQTVVQIRCVTSAGGTQWDPMRLSETQSDITYWSCSSLYWYLSPSSVWGTPRRCSSARLRTSNIIWDWTPGCRSDATWETETWVWWLENKVHYGS